MLKLCLWAVLLALLIPTALFSGVDNPAESPLPAEETAPLLDRDIRFTVLRDGTVETCTMADYLPGVLAGEMPASFSSQALMAQAVAARTYILHRMGSQTPAHPEAQICDDPGCCKAYADPGALQEVWEETLREAVRATDGEYLCYGAEPIEAVFHSSSPGKTESSGNIWNDRPYLDSVESPENAENVPDFVSTAAFSATEFQQLFKTRYPLIRFGDAPAEWISYLSRNNSGRVQSAVIGDTTLSGAEIRAVLGLRSTYFSVDYAEDTFTFTVTGYGHGVGMSQYGAEVYARQGLSYREILAHYYPGTELTTTGGLCPQTNRARTWYSSECAAR